MRSNANRNLTYTPPRPRAQHIYMTHFAARSAKIHTVELV